MGGVLMIDIPVQTALVIYIVIYVLATLVMGQLYFVDKVNKKPVALFLLHYSLSIIGAILLFYRESIPLFLSINIANLIIIMAIISLVYGVSLITKIKVSKPYIAISILLHVVLFLFFTYIDFNTNVRIIVQNIVHGMLMVYVLIMLSTWKKQNPAHKEIMSFIIYLDIFLLLYRSSVVFLGDDYGNSFLNFSQGSFSIMLSALTNSMMMIGLYSIMNNISQNNLVESERSKSSLLSNLPGFAYRCNNDQFWTMTFLSDAFEQVTGYQKDECLQNRVISFNEIIHEDDRAYVSTEWEKAMNLKQPCQIEYRIKHKNGKIIWIWEQGTGVCNDNSCDYIEGYIADITTRKSLEENLTYLSYRDSLTGLYNRRYIEEQLARLEFSRNLPISIIMADLNGLKFINDSFGHDKGDQAIQIVAEVFQSSLRGYELLSRVSGDEFIVILEKTDEAQVKTIVNRINENMKNHTMDIPISVSMGYATKNDASVSLKEVRKNAETMMYQVKIYEKPSQQRKAVDAVMNTLFEKDRISETHSQNVAKCSLQLARKLGLSSVEISMVETAALLHDVGKIICDESILISKNKLTNEQYLEMQKHSEIGYRILSGIPELSQVAEIILSHHERYDGTGYPNQLKGEEIPFVARIIAICDAYDAMIHFRYYREPLSEEEAILEIVKHKGTQFDPKIVDAFLTMDRTKIWGKGQDSKQEKE